MASKKLASGQYVLTGMSEEAREEARKTANVAKRERLLRKLERVHGRLEEASERRRVKVAHKMHQARNELQRVKLRLSDDPYGNAKRAGGGNAKNKSRLGQLAFQYPEDPDPPASTTKRTFKRVETIDPLELNAELSFRRPHGDFTSYMEAQIKLDMNNRG